MCWLDSSQLGSQEGEGGVSLGVVVVVVVLGMGLLQVAAVVIVVAFATAHCCELLRSGLCQHVALSCLQCWGVMLLHAD